MPEAQQLVPFRFGTRQRTQRVASKAWSAGQPVDFVLPRVGYLTDIFVRINQTAVVTSAASVVTAKAPYSWVSRFGLNANQGMAAIVDVSGFGAYLAQRTQKFGRDWTGDSALYDQFVAGSATTDTSRVCFHIPVSINEGTQFELGAINLQAPELEATFTVRCGALTDIGTNITSATGTIDVFYRYYEIPDPRQFSMPPLVVSRWLESVQSVSGTGEYAYTIPRQGTLYNLIQYMELNGAASDAWDSIGIRFNKTDTPYYIEPFVQRMQQRDRYGLAHITGTVYWDFFHAFGKTNDGDARDVIDTEELSTTEFLTNITAGTTLGANNNSVTSIRRIVQVLQ